MVQAMDPVSLKLMKTKTHMPMDDIVHLSSLPFCLSMHHCPFAMAVLYHCYPSLDERFGNTLSILL